MKLIDDAVTAGDIDADTGLIYKTFAVYGDDRLPAQYNGDPRRPVDHSVLENAHLALNSMSPANQALLAPFFVPPAYEGSWTDRLDGTAAAIPQVTGPPVVKSNWTSKQGVYLRIWSAKDPPNCNGLDCNEAFASSEADDLLDQEGYIWSSLTLLMDKEPLFESGDDHLNVFLVDFPPGTHGATTTIGAGCQDQPTYIQLDLNHFGPRIVPVFTHEFMHAIQYAYSPASCSDYEWWAEATAQYAIQYVYPKDQTEQTTSGSYLDTTDTPIEETSAFWVDPAKPSELQDAGARDYGAYVFPWFMDFKYDEQDLVRKSWENSESTADSLQAINDALDGGWKAHWADFQVANWNRSDFPQADNVSDDYQKQDEMEFGDSARHYNTPDADVKLNGQSTVTFHQTAAVPHLAAEHYWYKFSDTAIQSVQFFNEYPALLDDNVRVQALIKIAGDSTWKVEDWSQDPVHTFCLSEPKEKVEELVIIVSNAHYTDRAQAASPLNSRLTASAAGCTAWEGWFNASTEETASGTDLTFKTAYKVEVRYELLPDDQQSPPYYSYNLVTSDTVVWTVTGTQNGCSVSGTMQIPPAPGTATADVIPVAGSLTVNPAEGTYTANAVGHNSNSMYTLHCDSGDGQQPFPVLVLFQTDFNPTPIMITDSGPRLQGNFTWDLPGCEGKWSWSLRPAP